MEDVMVDAIACGLGAAFLYLISYIVGMIKDSRNNRTKFDDMSKDDKKRNDDWNQTLFLNK